MANWDHCSNLNKKFEKKYFSPPIQSQNNVSQAIKLDTNGKIRSKPEIWLSARQARVDFVVKKLGGRKAKFAVQIRTICAIGLITGEDLTGYTPTLHS